MRFCLRTAASNRAVKSRHGSGQPSWLQPPRPSRSGLLSTEPSQCARICRRIRDRNLAERRQSLRLPRSVSGISNQPEAPAHGTAVGRRGRNRAARAIHRHGRNVAPALRLDQMDFRPLPAPRGVPPGERGFGACCRSAWIRRLQPAKGSLLPVILAVEVTDLFFAVDSIPAVLAVSRDPFVVYTSNIAAILGLALALFRAGGVARPLTLPALRPGSDAGIRSVQVAGCALA